MGFNDFDDDAALDELERRLDKMPPSPKDPPVLSHPFETRQMVRRMARFKRRTVKQKKYFSMPAEVALHQPMHTTGSNGWFTFTSDISQETVEQAQMLLDGYFDKKKLKVEGLKLSVYGFHSGATSGAYTMLVATFTVV